MDESSAPQRKEQSREVLAFLRALLRSRMEKTSRGVGCAEQHPQSTLTVETCTDPSFLASLHSLFVIVKSGDPSPLSSSQGPPRKSSRLALPAPPLVVPRTPHATPVDQGAQGDGEVQVEGAEADHDDNEDHGDAINDYEVSVSISERSGSSSRQPPLPGDL